MGFAGAAGLVASGLTDIASSLGPFLPWFCFVMAASTLSLAVLIRKNELRIAGEGKGSQRQRGYCQIFVVAVGSLFGSVVLMLSGLFVDDGSGSNILSVLNEIRSGVERVEKKVDTVGEGVEGLGESVSILDITGRSGAGKIGDTAVFQISLANERLMDGASCHLQLKGDWVGRISVIDDSCGSFTVKLPSAPLLDANGRSLGDVVPVPFELEVLADDDDVIASYASTYPFHNNYRTIDIVLDPPGNRFKIDQQRKIGVDVGSAELPDSVECEWTVFAPLIIEGTSENGCVGSLATKVDHDSYFYKQLVEEGDMRDEIYVQINSIADFVMLGNATFKYVISQ